MFSKDKENNDAIQLFKILFDISQYLPQRVAPAKKEEHWAFEYWPEQWVEEVKEPPV